MRVEGSIKSWNAERGFGFIQQRGGGPQIFVHIKAFEDRSATPRIGQSLRFDIEPGPDGKQRAVRVKSLTGAREIPQLQKNTSAQPGNASYLAIAAFLILYLAGVLVWRIPGWVAGWYLAMSVLSFLFYAIDKSAAVAGRRRTSENTLILLGLAGGWPGAILAQRLLRHKSSKAPFQLRFWISVVFNVAAFAGLCSPLLSRLRNAAGW